MASLSRSEYRHEEQRRVTESPFRETKWDRHLDTLLTDLNESVGGTGRSSAGGGSLSRSLVPSTGAGGVVTEVHGAPGSGDFHERREYTSPDQRTRVIEERFEKTARGDAGNPSGPFYDSQFGGRHQSLRTTTYQLSSEQAVRRQGAAPLASPSLASPSHSASRPSAGAGAGGEQRSTAVQYTSTASRQRDPAPSSAAARTESHYQTIRSVSEGLGARPQMVEYSEELVPAGSARSQTRTSRTVTEWQPQQPRPPPPVEYTTSTQRQRGYTEYEEPPSTERRATRTVTQCRYTQPEVVPQREQYHSAAEYTDGTPVTVRYVDRKPITIYHDSRGAPGYMSPPPSAPVSPRSEGGTVYYERIIERQPIIHYYGARPDDADWSPVAPRRATLPPGQRLSSTATSNVQWSEQSRSAATLPAGQLLSSTSSGTQTGEFRPLPSSSALIPALTTGPQRSPRGRSPDAAVGGTVPGRLFISNRYETNNGMTTNRWPNADDRRDTTTGAPRPAHDLRSPDAVRSEPGYGRTETGYGRAEPYGRTEPGYGRPEPGFGRSAPRSPDPVRSEPDYARGYDFPRRGRDLPDDLRSEPEYGGGGEPEPWLWRGARTGSVRSVTGATGRQTTGEPFGRRYGSARAPGHGRRSPTYAEVYRSSAETYRRTEEPYRSAEPYRSTREPYQSSGEPYRSSGEPYRSSGEPYRSLGEPYRSTGEPYRSSTEPYGYSRPYQPPSGFASALSPVQPTSNNNRPSTNDGFRLDSNQSVTKQVYKTSSYSSEGAAPQTQPSIQQQQGDPSRFKQNILELDSLLDDLDHARKKPGTNGVDNGTTFDGPAGTSTPYRQTNVQKTTKTSKYVTSSGGDRQPTAGDQLTTLGLTGPRHSPSPNPLEGIDRGLVPELAEPPAAGTTRVTRYEYRSSNRRDVSPQPAVAPAPVPAPVRPVTVDRREYTSATSTLDRPQPPVTDTTDKTTTYVYNSERSGTLPPGVPGVPGVPVQPGSNTTINYHIYNYGTLGPDGQPVLPPGVPAPPPGSGTLPRRDVVTSSTTSSTSAHQYRETSPPPQRSPAPGPDTTVSNSYVFEKHSHNTAPQRHPSGPGAPGGPGGPSGPGGPGGPTGPGGPGPNVLHSTSTTTKHYTIGSDGREIPARPASPYDQQYPKFPVDDGPSGPQGHHTRTTTTTIERTQTRGSPFPARSPSPSPRRQQPRDDGPRVPFPGSPRRPVDDIDTPRRVDELMAQIPDTPQDGTYPRGPVRRDLNNGRTSSTTTTHFTVHEREPLLDTQTQVTLDAKSGAVVPQTASKPVSGPPIYYPPGSTEFKPKPESEMMFQSYESRGGGKYASGYKAKGKYKAKAGSKESHAEGGAVIPICLPLCCGAACSVM